MALRQFKGLAVSEIVKQGFQVVLHHNINGTTQVKHILSVAKPLPSVRASGNSKLQQKGKYKLLTFARLGQATKNLLQGDGYVFPDAIPDNVCVNCETCKGICYNKKQYFRDNHANNRINNYLHSVRPDFVDNMTNILTKYANKALSALRVNVEGELDAEYLDKLIAIANNCNNMRLYTYTKNYDLLLANYKRIPSNFNIMVSAWEGQPTADAEKIEQLKALGFKRFYARSKETPVPEGFIECRDNCNNCHNCIEGKNDTTCVFH